jgi:alpha-galactosidase
VLYFLTQIPAIRLLNRGTMAPKKVIDWQPGGIALTIDIDDEEHVWLRSVRPAGTASVEAESPSHRYSALPLAEVRLAGEGSEIGTSKRQVNSYLSRRLRYVRHEERDEASMKVLDVVTSDPTTGISVTTHFSVYPELPVLRSTVEVHNTSKRDVVLQMVASLVLGGLTLGSAKWWNDFRLSFARNDWFREAQWQHVSLPSVGLDDYGIVELGDSDSTRAAFAISNQGSFSTGGYLPMGALSRVDGTASWLWQIENNGSWRWEISDFRDSVYVNAGGPTDQDHQWSKRLSPGKSFVSVPVALVVVHDNFESLFAPLTQYRRRIRRQHEDNEQLPIIFNDYMNCLMGDPTSEKVGALIQPAAKAGAEYFCIDCGWYADGAGWWDSVGEWEPSKLRFPAGLSETLKQIRATGMIPGLWLEPEVVGVRSPVASSLPEDAFFQRNNQRVKEMGRYQLDYRHPAVIKRMDSVVDRLVNDYGVGYFKFDYNIDITQGTDINSTSPGDGALDHNRAYLAWINRIFDRFPNLVIENCSSGGQRMEYAMLATHPLQSTSDQQDPVRYAAIAASVASAVTPEQSATWTYPQPSWDDETNALTVVNSLLGRVQLSGHLHELSEQQHKLIADGVAVNKSICRELRHGVPFWPLGLPCWSDEWLALGYDCGDNLYLSVWRRGGEQTCAFPIRGLEGKALQPSCLYPAQMPGKASWNPFTGSLSVTLPAVPSARLFRLQKQSAEYVFTNGI